MTTCKINTKFTIANDECESQREYQLKLVNGGAKGSVTVVACKNGARMYSLVTFMPNGTIYLPGQINSGRGFDVNGRGQITISNQ